MKILQNYNKLVSFDNFFKFLIFACPLSIIFGNFFLNINILLINILFLYFIFKKKIKFNTIILYFVSFFIIVLILNVINSENIYLSIKAFLGIIKHLIFFFALFYFLDNQVNKDKYFKFIFFIVLVVSVDVLIQYFFGQDVFGFEYQETHGKRLSGPFNQEYVVGAYLSKLFLIGLFFLVKDKINFYLFTFYIIFVSLVIFLSQERSAFFMTLLANFLLIFLINMNLKKKIIIFFVFAFIISTFAVLDKTVKFKYLKQTKLQLGLSNDIHYRVEGSNSASHKINNFWDSRYGAHFLTAYAIFLDNKFLGSGIKSYRYVCSFEEFDEIPSKYADKRCNTHPHNLYFEMLSEGGLFLILPFSFLIIYLLLLNFKKLVFNSIKSHYIINISLILILFFPLQTTGSFFSTFNGVFYWIGLAVIFSTSGINILRKQV